MKLKSILLSAAMAVAFGSLACAASAATIDLTVDDSAGLVLSGVFTTDASTPANVLSFTGSLAGDATTTGAATLLGGQPGGATLSPDGAFIYDNVYFAGANPVFDNSGLLLSVGSGVEYNLYSNGPSNYDLLGSDGYGQSVSVSVTPVPEPASWAMMLVGFGGLGATMRTRRKAAITA